MFNEELYLRKLRAEYEFRVVEAQYSNYIFKEALLEFQKEFAELSSKQQEDISPQRIKKKKKLSKTTDKLYKKIASIVHPDKRGGDNEDFKKLRTAIEEDDMEMVESIAEKHNIDKVTQQSSMLAMVWHEATSEEKTELRHKIVDHYGGNNG